MMNRGTAKKNTEFLYVRKMDYLEINLIQNIKDNPDVDSMVWLDNMMTIWRKCGGRNNYINEKEE